MGYNIRSSSGASMTVDWTFCVDSVCHSPMRVISSVIVVSHHPYRELKTDPKGYPINYHITSPDELADKSEFSVHISLMSHSFPKSSESQKLSQLLTLSMVQVLHEAQPMCCRRKWHRFEFNTLSCLVLTSDQNENYLSRRGRMALCYGHSPCEFRFRLPSGKWCTVQCYV